MYVVTPVSSTFRRYRSHKKKSKQDGFFQAWKLNVFGEKVEMEQGT